MPSVRQFGCWSPITDGDTKKRQGINQPPMFDKTEMKLCFHIKQSSSCIRDDYIADGTYADRTGVTNQNQQPDSALAM